MHRSVPRRLLLVAAATLFCNLAFAADQTPGSPSARAVRLPPYLVEWVYRVKWGYSDDFWQIFRKYQIPLLDKEKQLGRVLSYTVYKPSLHTSEDQRWDYRVVITYRDQLAPAQSEDLAKQLFPDQTTFKREENERWKLIIAHYDLPIHEINPHASN